MSRMLVSIAGAGLLAAAGWWYWSPGLPVVWGPSAPAADVAAGRDLFEHEWSAADPLAHGDGLGPVFNAKSCVACHFQGGVGGGGSVAHNATSYEIMPHAQNPKFLTGTIHAFSTDPAEKETEAKVRDVYKVTERMLIQKATKDTTPLADPFRAESINSTALFGAGWVDRISSKAITHNFKVRSAAAVGRELQGDFSGIPVGRLREVAGGIGRFGWRAQTASLTEFVATACANEIGLGTPAARQAAPHGSAAADIAPDLDKAQFRQLLAFVDTLPRPVAVPPADAAGREAADRGKHVFGTLGCAVCHVPDLGGVEGVYSDFLMYSLTDPQSPGGGGGGGGGYGAPPPPPEFPRPSGEPPADEWKTPPLWGVADSAPYFHDGRSPTLRDAILRHRGQAREVTKAFRELPKADQDAVVAFLTTLKAPPEAAPLRDPRVTRLVMR